MGSDTNEVSSVNVLDCDSRVGIGLDTSEVIKLVTLGTIEDGDKEDPTAVDDSGTLEVKGDAVDCVVDVDAVAVIEDAYWEDDVDCVNGSDDFDDSDALAMVVAELVIAVLDEPDEDTEGVKLAEVETSFDEVSDEVLEVVTAEISTTE